MFENLFAWKPDKQWLFNAQYETRRTPDVVELSLSHYKLLFVCDDMKLDFEKYSEIEEHSAFVSRGFTQKSFNFFCRTVGNDKTYIPMEAGEATLTTNPCKISGEVHLVESTRLFHLDILKDNGVQFQRKRAKILIPHREMPMTEYHEIRGKRLPHVLLGKKGTLSPEKIFILETFMYVGVPEYWDGLINQPYFAGGQSFSQVWQSASHKEKIWLKRYYNLVHPYEKPKR